MPKISTPEKRTCWSCKKKATDQLVYYETTTLKEFVCQRCLDEFTMCDRCEMEIPPEQIHFIVTALNMNHAERICGTFIDPRLDTDVSSNVRARY